MALRACLDRAKFRLGAARKCTGLLQPMPLPSTAIPGSGGALAAADTAPTMNRRHVMPTPLSSTAVALNSPARCRFYGQREEAEILGVQPDVAKIFSGRAVAAKEEAGAPGEE
jgi:hypothetical protein